MAITLNDNFRINAGKPSESKYLNSSNTFYSNTSEVISALPPSLRYIGLTVNVNGQEYWFKDGLGNGDLVLKSLGGTGERIEKVFTQFGHTFVFGDVVEYSGTSFVKALGVVGRNSELIGFVTDVVSNDFTVVFNGYIDGLSGLSLSANTVYYLSSTIAGELTAIAPTDENTINKPILTTFTSSDCLVLDYRAYVNATGITGGGGTTLENVGGGEEIFSGSSNATSYLRTLIGSGNTTVSTVDDNIIIYSFGSGSTSITANNGLTKSGTNIRLGGTLTGNTNIDFNTYDLSITGTSGGFSFTRENNTFIKIETDIVDVDYSYDNYEITTGTLPNNGESRIRIGNIVDSPGIALNTYGTLQLYSAGFTRIGIVDGANLAEVITGTTSASIEFSYPGHIINKANLVYFSTPSIWISNDITTSASTIIRLYEGSDNGSNFIGFKAPNTLTGDTIWTLPSTDGQANGFLSTNGSGVLNWSNLTANNGLTKSGDNIYLGGSLTGNTTISGLNNSLKLNTLGNAVSPSFFGTGRTSIDITPTGVTGFGAGVTINANRTGGSILTTGTTTSNLFVDSYYGINIKTNNDKSPAIGSSSILMDHNQIMILESVRTNVSSGQVNITKDGVIIGAANNATSDAYQIILNYQTGGKIIDDINNRGIEYDADYSANFTKYSLVDKNYVTGLTSMISGGTGSTNITANNGLTKIGDNIVLGGALTGNTLVDASTYDLTFDIQTSGSHFLRGSIGSNNDIGLFKIRSGGATESLGLSDIMIGPNNGTSVAASGNIALGQRNLLNISGTGEFSGGRNVTIGFENGNLVTTGTHTNYIGRRNLYNPSGNTLGVSYSTLIGYEAAANVYLANQTTMDNSVAIGLYPMRGLTMTGSTSSQSMIAIGYAAMGAPIGGSLFGRGIANGGLSSIGIGRSSLYDAKFENYEIAIGDSSGVRSVIGRGNILIGTLAGADMTGGTAGSSGVGNVQFNVAIGTHTLQFGSGNKNTFIGTEAGSTRVVGNQHTGVGNWALNRTSGQYNTGLGAYAGYNDSTTLVGSGNTFIGYGATYNTSSLNNTIVLATNWNGANTSDRIYIGNTNQKLVLNSNPTTTSSDYSFIVRDNTSGELKRITSISGGSGGSGERIEKTFTQSGHTFVVGDVVEYSGTSFVKALAVVNRNSEIIGIVTNVNSNDFTVVFSGYIDGISGLTLSANTTYYLSSTIAGELTPISPTSGDTINKPILTTFTSDDALVFQYRGIINATGTTSISNGVGSGERIEKTFTQSGHTFVVGDVVEYSGNTFVKALAVVNRNSELIGFVSNVNSNDFTVVFSGYIDGISGLSLSANTTYYLSAVSDGELTAIAPTDENTINKPILTTFTSSDCLVLHYRGFANSTGTTSGSTSITANNGLTKIGDNIVLGGALTGNTLISSTTFRFEIEKINGSEENIFTMRNSLMRLNLLDLTTGYDNSVELTTGGITLFSQDTNTFYANQITVDHTNGILIGGSSPTFAGAQYSVDYSANYTDRSLVDKGYVDNLIPYIVNSSQTLSNTTRKLVLVNTSGATTITLPASPTNGKCFHIKDKSGNGLSNNITISGNGKNIDGSSTATIGTDYGSLFIVYSSVEDSWFTLAFIG